MWEKKAQQCRARILLASRHGPKVCFPYVQDRFAASTDLLRNIHAHPKMNWSFQTDAVQIGYVIAIGILWEHGKVPVHGTGWGKSNRKSGRISRTWFKIESMPSMTPNTHSADWPPIVASGHRRIWKKYCWAVAEALEVAADVSNWIVQGPQGVFLSTMKQVYRILWTRWWKFLYDGRGPIWLPLYSSKHARCRGSFYCGGHWLER